MRYVVLWESPSFCQSISVIFLISYLGLFQENPPRWGGPENKFFSLWCVCVWGGGGAGGEGVGGSANFSFLGSRNQVYFSFLGARCEAGYINTFC